MIGGGCFYAQHLWFKPVSLCKVFLNPSGDDGAVMHQWATELFPICRSITGNGLRESLRYIASLIPDFKIQEIPSGTAVFDWVVPDEWNISDAYIEDSSGTRVIDFKNNNLLNQQKYVRNDCTRQNIQNVFQCIPYLLKIPLPNGINHFHTIAKQT